MLVQCFEPSSHSGAGGAGGRNGSCMGGSGSPEVMIGGVNRRGSLSGGPLLERINPWKSFLNSSMLISYVFPSASSRYTVSFSILVMTTA